VISSQIIRRLESEGWVLARQAGSHHHYKKDGVAFIVTVPHPRRDMPAGTLRSICRAAGWEFPPRL
jgi:predicted RNA binding protein YcfA (HicA-like mRNA interferase family)